MSTPFDSISGRSFGLETPIEAIEEVAQKATCENCGRDFEEYGVYDSEGGKYYCDNCRNDLVTSLVPEAERYAKDRCMLTRELPPYEPSQEFACLPEEYALGAKESYTPNSYLTAARHEYTNYDELTKNFDRDSIRGQVYYAAVRDRIEEIIAEEIEKKYPKGKLVHRLSW